MSDPLHPFLGATETKGLGSGDLERSGHVRTVVHAIRVSGGSWGSFSRHRSLLIAPLLPCSSVLWVLLVRTRLPTLNRISYCTTHTCTFFFCHNIILCIAFTCNTLSRKGCTMNIDILNTKNVVVLVYKHHSFPSTCLVGDCSGRPSC